jgi:hypothetical protein
MDQNSTNGSGPDKRNWRERLGIGAKEMPKLSDEFRDDSAGANASRPAPRGAQPVTKPAPMAPRTPRATASASASSAAEPSPVPPPAPRATPRSPDNAAQEALAEKLRAQRAAAERLAEQRVQAARERAEGKVPPPPETAAPRQPAAASRTAASPPPVRPRATVPPPPPGSRPKFSFADEPAAARPAPSAAGAGPLSPPRPPLGGERGQPPFLRPSPAGLGARPQPPYRPVDPAANYGAPPRLQPPPGRSYGAEAGSPGYPAPRSPQRRPPPALESYPRQPEPREYGDGDLEEARQVPRLGRPARGRSPDDYDEVFEDDGRQRASARDYQAAYGESEDAFGEDQRRSSGPWLLLLALLAAALVTGGVVWYYNTNMRNVAGTGASTGEVPVVNAPADPAKVAPEAPTAAGEEPAARKKQIYDRIVGEQEVIGGQVESTEEIPVPPQAAQPMEEMPAAADTNPIPAPDAQNQGTGTEGLPTVDEPPPLPLPPAGEQGSLGQTSTERIAATAAGPEPGSTASPPPGDPASSSTSSTSSVALLPPPPDTATDGAALVSETAASASDPPMKLEEPEPAAPPPPPKKKAAAKKKPPVEEDLGAEPVVLVPPAEPVSPGAETASSTPVAVPEEPAPPPARKPRSIMDLFRGSGGNDTEAAQAGTRVAAVEPEQPAAPARKQAEPQPVTGSGFLVQLSSFRSEAEARKEYGRLSSLYPSVVGGLQQQIRQTSVGGSTRYQLGLGPLPSRSDATKVCSALITAGESDCIVRGR